MISAPCGRAARDESYRGEHKQCEGIVHANTGRTTDAATRYTVNCDCECHEGGK